MGMKVPGYERSQERKFPGTFVLRDRKFPRTKGPGNESSRELSFPENESETVEHFILHCPKHDSARSQLIDIVDPLWHNVKANGFVFDKLHLVVAPRISDHTVTRKDDLLVKSALFDFLISTNRQL